MTAIATEEEARDFVANLCGEEAMLRLDHLCSALIAENENQNLVAKGSLPHVWQRHVADSAQLLTHVEGKGGTWLDLGSGAGFPGLVIAAMRPDIPVVLVESRRRRIEWLKLMACDLSLENCRLSRPR